MKFKVIPSLAELNASNGPTLLGNLGIEFTGIGPDWVTARMPVDQRTHQPFGLLHGGASVVLAESVGSCAANLCVDLAEYYCVGLDINANHVKGVRSGWVYGTARPLHIGRTTQVWSIEITTEAGELVCISRLTMAVVPQRKG